MNARIYLDNVRAVNAFKADDYDVVVHLKEDNNLVVDARLTHDAAVDLFKKLAEALDTGGAYVG